MATEARNPDAAALAQVLWVGGTVWLAAYVMVPGIGFSLFLVQIVLEDVQPDSVLPLFGMFLVGLVLVVLVVAGLTGLARLTSAGSPLTRRPGARPGWAVLVTLGGLLLTVGGYWVAIELFGRTLSVVVQSLLAGVAFAVVTALLSGSTAIRRVAAVGLVLWCGPMILTWLSVGLWPLLRGG